MRTIISQLVKENINGIINDENINWDKLNDSTILITGATGLIGSFLYSTLSTANNKKNLNIKIISLGRNKEKLNQLDGEYSFCVDLRDSDCCKNLPDKVDYIFHCAAVTKSSEMISDPVGVITSSVYGTENMLKYAVRCNCKEFVYLSSMEIYGRTDLSEVKESDLGYIDLSNVRSCYPESKRICENLCISYMKQYHVPVKIARLAQTFGAGTPIDDTRVFAQFARSAMEHKDIILHTDGSSRGNYCYLAETVLGLFYILLKGQKGEIYNIANTEASCTIREMAEIVAKEISGKINVIIEDDDKLKSAMYASKTAYRLNSDKLKALGWESHIGIKEMYERMIQDWRERK